MTSQDNKTWQAQLQNMQAAQAAHHYNSYHYSEMYNSPGSSSHSGSLCFLASGTESVFEIFGRHVEFGYSKGICNREDVYF